MFIMPHWSEKPLRYHCGVLCEIAGLCIYIVGFGSPAWSETRSAYGPRSVMAYSGLWHLCGNTITSCVTYEDLNASIPPWLTAARVTCSIALILGLMALGVLLLCNCTKMSRALTEDIKAVRALPIIAGILGVIGGSTFAIRTQLIALNDQRLSWGFGILVTGSVCITLSACLLTYTPRPRQDRRQQMQTWSTGVAMPHASAGFGYWGGSHGGPSDNPAFEDATFVKPPDYTDLPPSYEEVMRETQ